MLDFVWQRPIFILGNPRSGTSLLRLILDSHAKISIPPESHFFLWLEDKYGSWNNKLLNNYLDDLFASTKFETWHLDKNSLKFFLISRSIKGYAELNSLINYYYALIKKKDVIYWGDKNSLWIEKLSTILEYYPNAFFVHIVRDGRDVACSYKELNSRNLTSKYAPKLSNNIYEIAHEWVVNLKSIESLFYTVKESNKITVKYEDLIVEPKKTITTILEKLGLQFIEEQLQFYTKNVKDIEPKLYFDWKEKLTQPIDKNNIGKFSKILSKDDIKTFNKEAKEILNKYSYL